MSGAAGKDPSSLSLSDLITQYNDFNAKVKDKLQEIASSKSTVSPGKFLQLQMETSSLAQIGESISNIIANANSVIKNAVQNQRAGA